jgi:beta-glucosidase
VQLYVAAIGSAVERAPQDLRASAQVELAPGASAPVTLRVPARDLAYWDVASGAWIVEPITYEARVLAHSGAPGLRATFVIE